MADVVDFRVLQVGERDDVGRRFNGHDLHLALRDRGINSRHLVWLKEGHDQDTSLLVSRYRMRYWNERMTFYETKYSLQSLLYFPSFELLLKRKFWQSSVVHYHILHNQFFSLLSLPLLTRIKPSIWTLHDPWALTGHCIWPYDCDRWKVGCGNCPDLRAPFPMQEDHTHLMWKIKRWIYKCSAMDVVVSSQIMYNMVTDSPLFKGIRIHRIPFGIDLKVFCPSDQEKAKQELGIPPENFVIAFRASRNLFKGLVFIKDVLHRLGNDRKITLIGFQADVGILDEFKDRYQVIEFNHWLGDLQKTVQSYNAADLFLMPSIKESFGMMAIEAMACAKPVIAFEGTALKDTLCIERGGGSSCAQEFRCSLPSC